MSKKLAHIKQFLRGLYYKMEVDIVPHIFCAESLALFQRFFNQHQYRQDSLLTHYTMAQRR